MEIDHATSIPVAPQLRIMGGRSLLFPLVGLLIVTVLVTMGVGYFINYPFLYESLHNKAKIEQQARAAAVSFQIDHVAGGLMQLALVVSRDGELQEAMTLHAQNFDRLMRKVLFLSENIRGLDLVGVVDPAGRILFTTEGVEEGLFPAEALKKGLKSGGHQLAAAVNQRWALLTLAPIQVHRKNVGVLVLGRWIQPELARRSASEEGESLAMAGPDGQVVSNLDGQPWPAPDQERIRSCLNAREPVTVLSEEYRGLHYAPLTILGQGFCAILPMDLDSIRQTLRDHAIRLGWSSLIIIGMIVLLGLTVHMLILQPLHRLRSKALILVEVCSNEKLEVPTVASVEKGNEIQILDQAFETASTAIYSYIGELHHQKERFEDMAIRDPLTGLGNRRLFNQLVEKSLAICHRYQRRMAIMYLDLDRFKPINDTLGHDIGDLLLKEVSARLKVALRDSDVVFRLGGDEFAALLPESAEGAVARVLGERLIQEVKRPYQLKGHHCVIGVSVGIAIYPDHAQTQEELIKRADQALYAAKDAGRGVCRLYEDLGV
ncbi:MAG: diguanylate cyclase [Magnetococcales bacterium]|nr:GGDEF domain-containing protein [Magnetococcales bacterium]NGZ07147.1 diguanylate cyclase [Magnetococcales bacterium]